MLFYTFYNSTMHYMLIQVLVPGTTIQEPSLSRKSISPQQKSMTFQRRRSRRKEKGLHKSCLAFHNA